MMAKGITHAARSTRRAVRRRSTSNYSGEREYVVRNAAHLHRCTDSALRVACLRSRHATSGHAATARTGTPMNHCVSCKSPRCVTRLSAQLTYPALPAPLAPTPRKLAAWSLVCLGLSFTGLRQQAMCDLPLVSHPRLGVQYPSVARRSLSRCVWRRA